MKRQISPVAMVAIVLVLVAAIGIYFWKSGGSGYQAQTGTVPGMDPRATGGGGATPGAPLRAPKDNASNPNVPRAMLMPPGAKH